MTALVGGGPRCAVIYHHHARLEWGSTSVASTSYCSKGRAEAAAASCYSRSHPRHLSGKPALECSAQPSSREGAEWNRLAAEEQQVANTQVESASDSSREEAETPTDIVDRAWASLPLDQLRRPGETGWGSDAKGPVGPEKSDNVYGKKQRELNSNAIGVIGMGSWRLRSIVSPLFETLVANIEGACRHLVDDLGLYPISQIWAYIDSLDPVGEYGSWSFQDLEPPEHGQPGWPRLQIENRFYTSRVFRKVHIEICHRQDGLEVFHCTMHPWLEFDLPILSMDVVAKDGIVSLGIIDLCPVSPDLSLPPAYTQICRALQQEYTVNSNRAAPDWGKEIFSNQCIMMRPEGPEQLASFVKYTIALTRVHLRFAHNADPIQRNKAHRTGIIHQAHCRFCEKQLLNSKTRRVLESAFSKDFAEDYMSVVMFETPNGEEELQQQEADKKEEGTEESLYGSENPVSAEKNGASRSMADSRTGRTSIGVQ